MAVAAHPLVIFFKEEKPNDPYVKTLNDAGFEVSCVQTLSFVFHNQGSLCEALSSPGYFSGVIFTSQRAVEAAEKAASSDWPLHAERWRRKKCFVVGNATADAAERLGLQCEGRDSGNAENLAQLILAGVKERELPLLFPCGNLKRETLPTVLHSQGLQLHTLTVYDTGPSPTLQEDLGRCLAEHQAPPHALVFFSPSCVRYSLPFLQSRVHSARLIAIGATTAEFMREQRLPVWAVCSSPDPRGLLTALTGLDNAGES